MRLLLTRVLLPAFICSLTLSGAPDGERPFPTLQELFTRPLLWGTSPSRPAWAKKAHVLVFLWNAAGGRFLDLYAYDADRGVLARLTDLENQKDELNRGDEDKDERLKRYLPPPSGLSSFDVQQDGKRVAFAFKDDLYLVDTDGKLPPLRLTRTKMRESSPQLSPDGRQLGSIRGGQILIQDLATGQIWQPVDVDTGAVESYRWSPDGKQILYGVRKGGGRTLPITNLSGRFPTTRMISRTVAGDELSDSSYFVVPAEGGASKAISFAGPGEKFRSTMPEWSPDGARLLTMLTAANWKKKRVAILDLKTLKPRTLYEESDPRWVDYGFAQWSPDSKNVLFTSEADGWSHLYTIAVTDGSKPVQLTHGNWEIHKETFSEDPQWAGEWIYFASTEGGPAQRQAWRIRPDGSHKEQLSSHEGLNIPVVSEDGKYLATMRADDASPMDLWVGEKRVTTSPRPEFHRIRWPEMRYVTYPSRTDKKPVAARLILPPGYSSAKNGAKRPAILYIHGSGYATSVLKQWGSYVDYRYAYNTYLASKGYVVLEMDYRGSTGYGRDWRAGVYLDMGGPDLDDVLGGVDYLASLGTVDIKRLGIWGVSYGGFMTDMALFRAPGVFKAGSAWAAVNDWENYNGGYTPQRLNTPESNPEAYHRSSPIWFSNQLKDHLLIIHGMVDDNVLFQDAVQLTEKLIHEGKSFDHAFYPEESHGFVRDETWQDALRRTTEWFDRWLQ